jgi:competence protein ComEA
MLNRRIPERQWLLITLLGTVLFSVFALRSFLRHAPAPAPAPAPTVVTVEGDVPRPGVYLLDPSTALVGNAVRIAGGIVRGTDRIPLDALGAAAGERIQSGQRIRVMADTPTGVKVSLESADAEHRLFLGEKLDLNRATVQDLTLVPRMTRIMAEAIVSRRLQRPWGNLDELQEIPGVGPRKVEKWREYLAVSGGNHTPDTTER